MPVMVVAMPVMAMVVATMPMVVAMAMPMPFQPLKTIFFPLKLLIRPLTPFLKSPDFLPTPVPFHPPFPRHFHQTGPAHQHGGMGWGFPLLFGGGSLLGFYVVDPDFVLAFEACHTAVYQYLVVEKEGLVIGNPSIGVRASIPAQTLEIDLRFVSEEVH